MKPQQQAANRRSIMIGTAGHVDHGKTALVAALTGKNTDRLKEEQTRGISIDIDFAPLRYPDGTLIGVVDVPGHERFIHNMVAGAAGVDAALLVIDANEGIKPQTLEHMAILNLLGIKHGMIALTKSDLVDNEWLDMVTEVIRESFSDTFLIDAPIIVTSTKTGQGIDELKEALHHLARECEHRDAAGAFRLPVDKVFSIPGIGTVATGTVWRGRISAGEWVDVLPERKPARIRSIQVHGQSVEAAYAGQRAALNLTGIERDDIRRGVVLAATGTLHASSLLDVGIQVLPEHNHALKHRERVHIHIGTAETVGRILLLEGDELLPGESGLAQILLDRPMACDHGDPFLIRTYSPVTTLGGGRIIDAAPTRLLRRKRVHVLEALSARLQQSPIQRILAIATRGVGITPNLVQRELGMTAEEAEMVLKQGQEIRELQSLPTAMYHSASIMTALRNMQSSLAEHHRKRRFSNWVSRTALTITAPQWPARDVDWLLSEGERRGLWELRGADVRASDWQVALTKDEREIQRIVQDALQTAGLAGVTAEQISVIVPKRDRIALALLGHEEECGQAIQLDVGTWVSQQAIAEAMTVISRLYEGSGPFSLGAVRDMLGISRKTAVMLLEYFDKVGITVRVQDFRYLVEGWKCHRLLNSV